MKILFFIFPIIVLCQNAGEITHVKQLLHGSDGQLECVPERYRLFLTESEIKEFEQTCQLLEKDAFKIYHITYYIPDSNKVIKWSDGYYFMDGRMGPETLFYPSGKVSEERNYAIYNSITNSIITISEFNKIKNKRVKGSMGYHGVPHGVWKYYSTEGKLIKEEEFIKGELIKTINY